MKRRGFLGLLTSLPFVRPSEEIDWTPRVEQPDLPEQTWIKDGTNPTSPAYTFVNDTNTGLYRSGTDEISFVVPKRDRVL